MSPWNYLSFQIPGVLESSSQTISILKDLKQASSPLTNDLSSTFKTDSLDLKIENQDLKNQICQLESDLQSLRSESAKAHLEAADFSRQLNAMKVISANFKIDLLQEKDLNRIKEKALREAEQAFTLG